jgi:hypothetical protein
MNKFIIAAALVVMSSSAFAKHAPLPPKRPADLNSTTVKLPNGVVVTYPAGAKVDIDQDGRSLDLEINQPRGWFENILP